jgi:hypothetical protein
VTDAGTVVLRRSGLLGDPAVLVATRLLGELGDAWCLHVAEADVDRIVVMLAGEHDDGCGPIAARLREFKAEVDRVLAQLPFIGWAREAA